MRKIAAIVVTDIVGFSRLAEADEDRTLARLRALNSDLINPTVAIHRGRLVKRTGDGAIIEFRSAVDAVTFAAEVQDSLAERNAGVAPDRQMTMRIGIHIGDVIEESDGDLMGDGINIAARLESICEPGGIWLSEDVHRQIGNRVTAEFADLGEQPLKNIARSMRVYRMVRGTQTEMAQTKPAGAVGVLPSERISIAVLPLANMSGDPAQQVLCDGLTEDIVTDLSRFRNIRVLSSRSSPHLRGTEFDAVKLGRELHVSYLMEGSVRRLGSRVRITVQLVDAASGSHLWAERYDSGQDEIFDVQDQVVQTIAATLAGRVRAAWTEVARRKPPANLAAYEHLLRGDALPIGDPAYVAEAKLHFEKAIELDPGYARAYAMLSGCYEQEWYSDTSGSDHFLDQAFEMARKAVALDEYDVVGHLAMVWAQVGRDAFELAEQHLDKALTLNANFAPAYGDRGIFLTCMGYPDKGIESFAEMMRVDPLFMPSWYWGALGEAHFVARRHDEAIAAMRRSAVLSPRHKAWLAASYALTNRPDLAREYAAEVLRLMPGFSLSRFLAKEPLARAEDVEHLASGLRLTGLPG